MEKATLNNAAIRRLYGRPPARERRDSCYSAGKGTPPSALLPGCGLSQDETVAVRVRERGEGSPRLLPGLVREMHSPGRDAGGGPPPGRGVDHQALERAGRHGGKPGDQRQGGRGAGGPHLDPAPALAVRGVAHLLESEVLQVEGLGPVLVADRYRDDLDAKLRHGNDPLVRR